MFLTKIRIKPILLFILEILVFSNPDGMLAASTSIPAGQTVKLSVTAQGTSPFSYQWYKDGKSLSGATGSTYSISSMQSVSAGAYYAKVSNSAGSTVSDTASLTLKTAGSGTSAPDAGGETGSSLITFTIQPQSQGVTLGQSVTLRSTAVGIPTPGYQWYKDGKAISGSTRSFHSISSVTAGSAGTYTVVASNLLGSKTSNKAVLTVGAAAVPATAPKFTTQPVGKTVATGTSVTLTAVASGSPKPAYQWKRNGTSIPEATDSTYKIASASSANAGTYTVVATNSKGSATSNGAVLAIASAINRGPTLVDFNSDGRTDMVWNNRATGQCVIWLMSGTQILKNITFATSPAGWALQAAGDFNGDGNADLLWQNETTGERSIWLMTGTTIGSKVSLGKVSVDWDMKAVGDFNGDKKADILLENTVTGERSIWLMSGTKFGSKVSLGKVDLAWRIGAVGDFDGDEESDILWENILTGERSLWFMSGTKMADHVSMGTFSKDWTIAAGGDFDGDGESDIIWQNIRTGECFAWLLAGSGTHRTVALGTRPTSWIVGN